MPSPKTPYLGFEKNPRGVKTLWERFNSGLIDPETPRNAYETLLLQEWQRCSAIGVDVAMTVARKLNEEELRQRAASNRLLVESAVPVIQDVGRFIDFVPGIITLTEHTGCILHVAGQAHLKDVAAQRSGIVSGSLWGEKSAGNNGMGTVLTTLQPAHVLASEHFCEGWQAWSCAAAPIFDFDGRSVIGVVNFTTTESLQCEQGLALCVSMAKSISAHMALHRAFERNYLTVAFGEATRRYPNDDLLALDRAGNVALHTLSERMRRTVEDWQDERARPAVKESVNVVTPETGEVIGKILLLTRPAGYEKVFQAAVPVQPLRDAVQTACEFGKFTTCDPDTCRMLGELERVAAKDVNILLHGETGTGKDLIARHIHARSTRRGEPYLAVNCGAISAELVESTLFGYVRGAFSGADPRGRAGYFESAAGGTLFLDEIGELPLAMQAALLRVLEDGSFSRVGSTQTLQARCRIVAATHRNLEALISRGQFRQDLYYRLNIFQKTIKPLRERPDDIPLLIEKFIGATCQKHDLQPNRFTLEALKTLQSYAWPGNARELRNVVEAAMLHTDDGPMGTESLPPELRTRPDAAAPAPSPASAGLGEATREYERQLIIGMLQKYCKINHVAKALGIARSTLYRKFAELDIDQSLFTGADAQ